MKRAYLTTAILLCLSLTACSDDNDTVQQNPDISQPPISQPEPTPPTEVEPEVPVEEVPIPEIYLDENFDQMTTLPGNWIVPKNNTGTVYIKNGDLHIDGRTHNTQMTRILLPETFQKLRNYRIDMEFSFEESNNTGR